MTRTFAAGSFAFLSLIVVAGCDCTATAANTGISSVSMVACCAHHLTDILPLLGLAGLSLFLTRYQTWLIGVGIISNFLGVVYLIKQIRKHAAHV